MSLNNLLDCTCSSHRVGWQTDNGLTRIHVVPGSISGRGHIIFSFFRTPSVSTDKREYSDSALSDLRFGETQVGPQIDLHEFLQIPARATLTAYTHSRLIIHEQAEEIF